MFFFFFFSFFACLLNSSFVLGFAERRSTRQLLALLVVRAVVQFVGTFGCAAFETHRRLVGGGRLGLSVLRM